MNSYQTQPKPTTDVIIINGTQMIMLLARQASTECTARKRDNKYGDS